VRVLRIDGAGVETPLPVTRLRVLDPVPTPPTTWDCPGQLLPDGSRIFRLLDAAACRKGEAALTPLPATPTYVVANLTTPSPTAPAVDAPLSWQVDLPAAQPAGQVYVEFTVVNQACVAPTCNALRVSEPEVDLGRLQTGQPHLRVLEVTNVGPEPLRVGTLRMEAIAGYPDARADFGLEALSDPQPLTLPIELTASGLSVPSDFGTHPLVRESLMAGDTAYVRPLDVDGGRVVFMGHALEARGRARFESHRIVYDDPAANFSSPAPAPGVRRPFAQVAHLRRQPPFYVNPGSSIWVRVTATPRALGGRRARLSVGATADSNPAAGVWASSVLKATGISGPSLSVVPAVLSMPRPHLDPSGQVVLLWELGAFVANYGGVDMQRTTIAITGPDAARFQLASPHASAKTIPPGHDEAFMVRYVPSCAPPLASPPAFGPRQFRAQLRVTTNGGVAVVELRGEHCPMTSP
jgi:hypothetical protein